MDVRIGCSGYYYRHWRGLWYPEDLPSSRWFAFYAERFDTVEINSSFYRFPTAATVRRWLKQAPGNFVYAVKAPRLITHLKRFHDCASLLDDFFGVLTGLGAHLGCVLFQLPPSLHYSEQALAQLLTAMHPDFRTVIEFRHASWWRPEVVAAMRENLIGFCTVGASGLPNDLMATAPDIYLRLHGDPWYTQDYGEAELKNWVARIRSVDAERAWIYFNNDHHAFAPANAMVLRRLLGD